MYGKHLRPFIFLLRSVNGYIPYTVVKFDTRSRKGRARRYNKNGFDVDKTIRGAARYWLTNWLFTRPFITVVKKKNVEI